MEKSFEGLVCISVLHFKKLFNMKQIFQLHYTNTGDSSQTHLIVHHLKPGFSSIQAHSGALPYLARTEIPIFRIGIH